jgi:hypothetical protein
MKAHKLKDEGNMKHDHESRITRLEVTNENINATLLRLEKKMDDGFYKLDLRIDNLETKFNGRLERLDSRLWQIMLLMGTTVLGFIISKMLGVF